MKAQRLIIYAAMLLTFALPHRLSATVLAQADAPAGYDLAWWTVDSGGGRAVGEPFTLHGTVGQPDAGYMAQGEFAVVGGYWSPATVQAPPDQPPADQPPGTPPDQGPPDQGSQPLYLPAVMR